MTFEQWWMNEGRVIGMFEISDEQLRKEILHEAFVAGCFATETEVKKQLESQGVKVNFKD